MFKGLKRPKVLTISGEFRNKKINQKNSKK